VPNAIDLVTDPDSKRALELILIRQEMGRPFALPPRVAPERVAILRQAFEETLKDPQFVAEAAKLQLEIDPLTGAEIEGLLKSAYSAPKSVIERAAKLAR
jgi:tripartite-type tricarboxylate transporter receptor subunit TctC